MIELNIFDKELIAQSNAVADGVKFETVRFTFPDNWAGYKKTAVFKNADGLVLNVVLDKENPLCIDENECYIPYEMLTGNRFSVSVFGVLGDSVATTTEAEIDVLESGYANGGAPSTPTPSQYQQLINLTENAVQIAQSVRADADNGLFKGDKGDIGPQGIQGEKGEKGDSGELPLDFLNNSFAPIIRNTVSGKQIRVRDVSSVEHELKIKVSGAENVTVYRYGKNVFDLSHLAKTYIARYNGYAQKYKISQLSGKNITFQISVDFTQTIEANAYVSVNLYWFDENNQTIKTNYGSQVKPNTESKVVYVTAPVPTNAFYVGFGVGVFFDGAADPQEGSTITLYNPQVEFDTTPTEYQPYDLQVASVDAEGIVQGLTSVSPVTVLLTDNSNAVINLEYNADTKTYIDNKFAELQALVLEG